MAPVGRQGRESSPYEDFAVAIVREIENGRFIGTRFTVGY
jgi:putative NADH-flavin reductase